MITPADVTKAFQLVLGRMPESSAVIEGHCHFEDLFALGRALINSREFKLKQKQLDFQEKWIAAPVYENRLVMWLDLHDKYVSFGCLCDGYEPVESEVIRMNVPRGGTAVDVGANIGWHTLGLALAVGSQGRVHAFEPRQPTADYLQRTLCDNRLESIVQLHRVGLWDVPDSAVLRWPEQTVNPGSSSIGAAGTAGLVEQPISLVTLDSFDMEHVDFIKIDIEGAEPRAMRGAERTLRQSRPIIMCELFPEQLRRVCNVSSAEFLQWMGDRSYKCLLIERGHLGKEIRDFPDVGREVTNVVFIPRDREVHLPT